MRWVECSVINMQTNKLAGKYSKTFVNQGDYNSWFKIVKTDCDTIINTMTYDPEQFPGQKLSYDILLLRLNKRLVYEN
jgi:hypothetical protein